MSNKFLNFFYLIILFFILLTGFLVRFYQIEKVPSGIYPDEAVNGIDALKANLNRNYKTFYTDNNGREGLFINLIALSFRLWNISVLGLKFPSIILGTLLILGTFLLTYEIFRKNWYLGLLTSYFIAFSFTAINFSRIAFRAILLPVVLVFSFYFLFLGWHYLHKHFSKNNKSKKFTAHLIFFTSGLIFGIGLHSYIAFRIAPAILIVFLIFLFITEKHFWKKYWFYLITFIIGSFISASPLLITFYHHPEYLESRSASVSVFSPELNHGHLWKTLERSFFLSIFKYSFWGDQNWRHNYPPFPILNPFLGIFFLIGFFYTFFKFFHLFYLRFQKKIRDEKLYLYAFLQAWFFFMLMPEFLTAEGNPHALRAIGALPVVYIFSAIPFIYIFNKAKNFQFVFRQIIYSIIGIILISISISNIIKYHYFYANNPHQQHAFETNLIEIANYVKTIPSDQSIIFISGNMQRIPIKLFNYQRNIIYIHPNDFQEKIETPQLLKKLKNEKINIIFTDKGNREEKIIQKIKSINPNLQLIEFSDGYQNHFYILKF